MTRTAFTSLWSAAVLVGCIGCQTMEGPGDPLDLERAVEIVERPVAAVPAFAAGEGANFELLAPDSPEVQAAMEEYERTGRAPHIQKDGFLYVPYDGFQTNLYCKTTRVCRIELAAGEVPIENGVFLGDSARWWWGLGAHGDPPARVYSILFKPLWSDMEGEESCAYSTNMVVQTNLRTYQIGLLCNERKAYTRVLRFYYPEEVVRAWRLAAEQATERATEGDASEPLALEIDVDSLNIDDYRIDGPDVEWRPVRVFDDGTHVYLQMPESMRAGEAPAVFVRSEDGGLGLVNYRHIGRYLRIDRRFDELVLVAGKGWRQKRVRVRYDPDGG